MNRIDRISAILIQLQSKRVIKAQDIAERFQISLRTVYRDIRTLEQAGIPLIGEAGIGYSLLDGFRLPPVMFTPEEAIAFLTAEKLVAKLTDSSNSKNYSSAMYKIRAVLNRPEKDLLDSIDDRIEVLSRPGDSNLQPDLHLLQPILKSVDKRKVLSIKYHSNYKQEETDRFVEPMGIFFADQQWHLIAWCRMRNDYRDFRLDRVIEIKETTNTFENTHPDLKEYLQNRKTVSDAEKQELELIVIKIDRSKAFWLNNQKYYHGFVSQRDLGNYLEWTFLSSYIIGFARWYLMFADCAFIEESEALKLQVKLMLERISKRLSNNP